MLIIALAVSCFSHCGADRDLNRSAVVHFLSVPRSIPIIDWLLTLILVGGVRFSARLLLRRSDVRYPRPSEAKRVLVMGAGDAGAMIVREMHNNPGLNMLPVGFVDDILAKSGMTIHGIPVLGARQDIPALVVSKAVDQVIIAMPAASGKDIRAIISACQAIGVHYRTIPGVFELISGQVSVKQIRDVRVEDLLRREPVEIDRAAPAQYLGAARVLVTGAGGSIGSELCRQVAGYGPRQLVLLGHGESSIYSIDRELRGKFPSLELRPCIADVRDPQRLSQILAQYQPQVVFHAAAHKHVPLMERNVEEAVTNNILGTQCVLEQAIRNGVARFVLISSDKAVNPINAMGGKQVAEMLVQDAAQRRRGYLWRSVWQRAGQPGSVIPLFQEQIAAGGPVMVTDPAMERFFVTILGPSTWCCRPGAGPQRRFMLDMGQPVRIVDLARI
jgi:FlaA1/EpsC-like NDP-sugar epimerase